MAARAGWRIGWRNLGRNPRRTWITAIGLAVGYVAVVVMSGLGQGLVAEMVDNGTGLVTGQVQVHAPDYLPDRSLHATMGGREGVDVPRVVSAVESVPAISGASPRVYGAGLVSTGSATAAGLLMGVDPDRERSASRILETIEEGRAPRRGAREILIGIEMARTVNARVGDTVVLVAPSADGSLGNDLFAVSGLFETGVAELDLARAILPIDVLQDLLVLAPGRIHEVAARVEDPWAAPAAAAAADSAISTSLGGNAGAEARAWTEFRPEMVDYARLTGSMQWVLLVVVFGMAVFGVANTLLMASFERRREFALLLALGTRPRLIVGSVLAEALALAALSLAAGLALAAPILAWWHRAPPDVSWLYGGFTMAGGLMRPVLRVEVPWTMLYLTAGALFVTALLAALLPAWRSARVPPADTLAGR